MPTDSYNAYTAGTNNVNTVIYLKTKTQKVKNIWNDAQSRSLGGSTSNVDGKYVPNNMLAASKWFAAGWYENSVLATNNIAATLKLGIKGTVSNTGYWTIFDNFRLYYYGGYTTDDVTPVDHIMAEPGMADNAPYYDLSGRRVQKPIRGLYIQNGKKVVVK
jgi:hypothetical protein